MRPRSWSIVFRLEYQPLAGSSIHHHAQRRLEPQMPHAAVFFERWRLRQPVPVYEALPRIGIHREIPNLKCREVLEEMAALRRRNPEIPEPGFHDHARA